MTGAVDLTVQVILKDLGGCSFSPRPGVPFPDDLRLGLVSIWLNYQYLSVNSSPRFEFTLLHSFSRPERLQVTHGDTDKRHESGDGLSTFCKLHAA